MCAAHIISPLNFLSCLHAGRVSSLPLSFHDVVVDGFAKIQSRTRKSCTHPSRLLQPLFGGALKAGRRC
jgi:hypothetical protein